MIKRIHSISILAFLSVILLLSGCQKIDENGISTITYGQNVQIKDSTAEAVSETQDIDSSSYIPYMVLNDNMPAFSEDEVTTESFEYYSELDELGRCGTAFACIGIDLMPTEERGAIGQVRPTGWHTTKYDCIEGKYLYNRCHLIGYQLSGENANEKNLITGTRYLNTEGMLPFENIVADYVKNTGNHVMYRVTPEFEDGNLLASGVQIEAWSVEDEGKGVCFNIFAYNIQPGIMIDYMTGESEEITDNVAGQSEDADETSSNGIDETQEYILNVNTQKFHFPSCSSVQEIKEKNKRAFTGSRQWLLENGYEPCGRCKP